VNVLFTVINALVQIGIDEERLERRVEDKPVNGDSTPEEKANNRRVEFVKNLNRVLNFFQFSVQEIVYLFY
jgi:hypothetical protein